MVPQMAPIQRCTAIAGLAGHEIVLGVSAGEKHERMLARYRRTAPARAIRARLVAQIRDAVEAGAPRRAADLLVVLRRLLAEGERTDRRAGRRRLSPRRRATGALPAQANAGSAEGGGGSSHVLSVDFRRG